MNESTQTPPSAGQLQWSRGSWFGSIIGSTCWMVAIGIQLVYYGHPALAIAPVISFAIINVIATLLWQRRHRFDCTVAYMIVIGLISVAIPVTLVPITFYASPAAQMAMQWPPGPFWHVGVYLLAPVTLVIMYLKRLPG